MDDLTHAQIKAGLAAFHDWHSAPLGVGFETVVCNIYQAMTAAAPQPAPEPEAPSAPEAAPDEASDLS